MTDKLVPDYAAGKPTAAQTRKRWVLLTGLFGGSIASAAVRLALAQPAIAPVQILGDVAAPVPPTTQPIPPAGIAPPPPPATRPAPAALPGEIAPPVAPATRPAAIKGGVRAPDISPASKTRTA